MKKIVSMMTALCSLLSVGVMFTACGHECEFATEWSKDATNHWHACTDADCTEVADKAEHTWDAGTVTTPATLTTKGVKTYTCTACAQTKTEEFEATTTVTAEQWATAFDFSDDVCNVTIAATAEMEQGGMTISMAMSMQYILTANVMYGKSVESMSMGAETQEEVFEAFFTKEGEAYYEYEQEEVEGQLVWIRTTGTAEDFADAKSEVNLSEDLPFSFANATYDAATKTYTIADIAGNPAEYEPGYKNIKIQFVDGKVVSMTFVMVQGNGMELEYVLTASYTNVTAPAIPTQFTNGDAQSQPIS